MKLILPRVPAVLAAAVVALAAGALASLAPGSPLVASCVGAGSGHAALVLEHGDGSVVTRCVSFGTATLTGEQLLDSSGVAWSGRTFGGYGEAVCALDSEPAHYASCPGQENYWAVFVSRGGGAWQLSSIGISSLTLGDGDAEGFRYVPAAGTPAVPPSLAVCGAALATVAATAATAAARPTAGGVAPASSAAASPVATNPPATSAAAVSAAATAPADDTAAPAPAAASAGVSSDPGAASWAPSSGSAPGSGLDAGLFVAALVGGGLAGLALLRLAAARRRAT